jgi:hypothetical protein
MNPATAPAFRGAALGPSPDPDLLTRKRSLLCRKGQSTCEQEIEGECAPIRVRDRPAAVPRRAGGRPADARSRFVTGDGFHGNLAAHDDEPRGRARDGGVWDENGVVKASVQAGRFPPIDVTGILKDADMLVLTLTRFENGKPVRAVVALTVEGDSMSMAQMLEFSQTIKRGSGRKADQSR